MPTAPTGRQANEQGVAAGRTAAIRSSSPELSLAHLQNAAAHGPANSAVGDSWKHSAHGNSSTNMRLSKLLLAGGLAGALSRTATAPIDRLRMLQQVHRGSDRMSLRQGWKVMTDERTLRAFFRGNGTNVCKQIPEMGIKLCIADQARLSFAASGSHPTVSQRLVIGGCAGAIAQAVVYPLEVVQTRMAVSRGGSYSGIVDALFKIVAREGVGGLFRGIIPCMVGILPYAGIDIAVFGLLREHLSAVAARPPPLTPPLPPQDRSQHNDPGGHDPAAAVCSSGATPVVWLLLAGMVSSTMAQLVSFPLGLVGTRLKAQGMAGRPVIYSGMMDAFRQILRLEGVQGLYKGWLPDMAKIAPASAISWTVFEKAKTSLGADE